MEKEKLEHIQSVGKKISILYVDDNRGLRDTMQKTLSKLFENYLIASDGEEGLVQFLKHRSNIVITDINMPKLNGIEMARKIKNVSPHTKIIVLSSHEENHYLHQAIELGVFRFLMKPTLLPKLIDVLLETIDAIESEEEEKLFSNQLSNIFNYQDNMIMMCKGNVPTLANQSFFDFFGVKNLMEFLTIHKNINELLQEEEDFLYGTTSSPWLEQVIKNQGILFHVKLNSAKGDVHHMLLKSQKIPEEENHTILSFNDISELNLLALPKSDNDEPLLQAGSNTISKMMSILYANKSKVKLHNIYKGITISNQAQIIAAYNESIVVTTSLVQLKAICLFKTVTLSTEIFPLSFVATSIDAIDKETLTVTLSSFSAIQRSEANRKKIRVKPEDKHSFTLFSNGFTCVGESTILDISIDSMKVEISDVPPELKIGSDVTISFVLYDNKVPLMITTQTMIIRMEKRKNETVIVFAYDLEKKAQQGLKEYIATRQRILINEFKALPFKE